MLFSSFTFLLIFLPFTYIVHGIIPKDKIKWRNIFLLVMSCAFYAWGGLWYFLIMLGSILLNYFGALLIAKQKQKEVASPSNKPLSKIILIIVITLNLGLLFYFKYYNFLLDFVGAITARKLDFVRVALPIGISFFTFQAMSYTIDVYQGKAEVQKSIFDLALFISLFPQLIAGPIVKYGDIKDQLEIRETTPEKTYYGIRRFIYGLAKKVLIANTMALVVDNLFALQPAELGSSLAWIGSLFYAFQIYYDFSGYSDMAIGLGAMFGFKFMENFNYPYIATSVQDFWRRWHISLSAWFKEYLYIPLGGNRKGKLRTYLNLAIVFLLTGLWHGANYTFVFWGLFYGIFLILERAFLGDLLKKNPIKPLNWLYSMVVVLVAWVFFRSENVTYAFQYIGQMFAFRGSELNIMRYVTLESLIALPFAILLSGVTQTLILKRNPNAVSLREKPAFFYSEAVLLFALLFFCILILAGGSYNPFIYFQF